MLLALLLLLYAGDARETLAVALRKWRGGAAAAVMRLGCGVAGAERRSRGAEVASSSLSRDRT